MREPKTTLDILPIIIRRSVALFAIRVIFLELVFEVIYLTWRTLIHYLPFSLETAVALNGTSIIFFIILVTIIQNIILVYITLNWVNDYYEFRVKDIAHFKGIFGKTKQSFQYRDIQSITIQQSMMGRMFNFGNVMLFIPTLGYDVHFTEVSDPRGFVDLLKTLQPEIEGARFIVRI